MGLEGLNQDLQSWIALIIKQIEITLIIKQIELQGMYKDNKRKMAMATQGIQLHERIGW